MKKRIHEIFLRASVAFMKAHRMSKTQLCEYLGVSRKKMHRYESDHSHGDTAVLLEWIQRMGFDIRLTIGHINLSDSMELGCWKLNDRYRDGFTETGDNVSIHEFLGSDYPPAQ